MNESGIVSRPIRVLVAKPGLDGHDRGALIVAQGLRDAGMEVIYTGLRQTPAQIVAAAIQEDVDCIGLSSLSGAHMSLFPDILAGLRQADADDILVIAGGVIPADDAQALMQQGIAAVFTPGSSIGQMAEFIRMHVRRTEDAPPQRVDHIGIAVRSLAEALPFYTDHLQFKLVSEETIADQGVRVAMIAAGETHIELLEPTRDDSPIARFLARNSPGLHHVAYAVDDVSAWIARAERAGLHVIDKVPKRGAGGKWVAFVHPKSTGGVLTEYCQSAEHGEEQ